MGGYVAIALKKDQRIQTVCAQPFQIKELCSFPTIDQVNHQALFENFSGVSSVDCFPTGHGLIAIDADQKQIISFQSYMNLNYISINRINDQAFTDKHKEFKKSWEEQSFEQVIWTHLKNSHEPLQIDLNQSFESMMEFVDGIDPLPSSYSLLVGRLKLDPKWNFKYFEENEIAPAFRFLMDLGWGLTEKEVESWGDFAYMRQLSDDFVEHYKAQKQHQDIDLATSTVKQRTHYRRF